MSEKKLELKHVARTEDHLETASGSTRLYPFHCLGALQQVPRQVCTEKLETRLELAHVVPKSGWISKNLTVSGFRRVFPIQHEFQFSEKIIYTNIVNEYTPNIESILDPK